MAFAARIVAAALALAVAILAPFAPGAGTAAAAGRPAMALIFYRVQRGDTLSQIARRFGADVRDIARRSGVSDPDRLSIGEVLVVPLSGGTDAAGAGDAREAKAPAPPAVAARAAVLHRASPASADASAVGEVPATAAGLVALLSPRFAWPVAGRISSKFGPRWGRMHEGIDVAVSSGTPVRAAAPGIVVRAGWESGYGRVVVIDHSFGLETVYAHASRLLVHEGEAVAPGEAVALAGASGDATGPHVHFEIRFRGHALDPLPLLEPPQRATSGG